jgi:hypothetical protein
MADYTPGALTKVQLACPAATAINSVQAVLSCSMGKRESLLQRNGIRGTRSHFDTDIRKGPQRIGGTINCEPSFTELNYLMALVMSNTTTTPLIYLTDELLVFNTIVDRKLQIDTYTYCKVSRLTLSGTQGGIISASVDVVGVEELLATGAVAAFSSTIPFLLSDAIFTLNTAVREVQNFTLVIDNHIDAERFLNSIRMSQVVPLDRTITLSVSVPYNTANITTASLYDQIVGGSAGRLALNNGTFGVTFAFGRLQAPAESVDIPGKTELMLQLNMIATKVNASAAGVTDELIYCCTNSIYQ